MTAGNKTILITGSTDGVGRRVAQRLARPGMTILLHGRNRVRGEQVLADIRKAGGAGAFYEADFAALAEIRALAAAVARDHERLDVLINNAGIGSGGSTASARQTSRDGHELRFAVNYLAGFLLTYLLMPRLKAGEAARIVNVSSLGQQAIEFDDVMLTRGYTGMRAYCQSKLAQILFTVDLAQELDGTGMTTNALHPATYMDTTMVRTGGITPISTVDEGAEAILHLAEGADMTGRSGLFYNGLVRARANAQADDAAARTRLRALSLDLVGLSAPTS
jgi:NAD(P)-dependent dehydrogenase (short-subunit alcohol dehydrogenase family)